MSELSDETTQILRELSRKAGTAPESWDTTDVKNIVTGWKLGMSVGQNSEGKPSQPMLAMRLEYMDTPDSMKIGTFIFPRLTDPLELLNGLIEMAQEEVFPMPTDLLQAIRDADAEATRLVEGMDG